MSSSLFLAPSRARLPVHSWRRWNTGGGGASSSRAEQNQRVLLYLASVGVGAVGMSYAAVPLYKAFCQRYGFGGDTGRAADPEQAAKMRPVKDGRQIKITFNADTSDMMPWKFRPTTREVRVVPGETALAFYKANNPTEKTVTGVSTYNITPYKAGVYFNKIQCFCFEEQRLKAKEEVEELFNKGTEVDAEMVAAMVEKKENANSRSRSAGPLRSGAAEPESRAADDVGAGQ